MLINKIAIGLLAVTASASAQQTSAGNNTVTGSVETIYVCESRGFFIEKKLLRKTSGREVWADVRFGDRSQGAASNELALLEADSTVERGDIVEMRLAESVVIPGTLRDVTRVSKLVARRDTMQALLFRLPLPDARQISEQFAQAKMYLMSAVYDGANRR